MSVGPVEAESRTPIVNDKRDVLAYIERFEKSVEELSVLNESVGAGTWIGQLL